MTCDICGKSPYCNFHDFRAAIEDGEGAQDAVGDFAGDGLLWFDFETSLETADFAVCSPECAETLYRWTPGERRARLAALGREMASPRGGCR